MDIKSPLTNSSNIALERTIETDFIIEEWKKLGIDVARLFHGISEIYVYKCNDTGYRFYYPFNLEGDSEFYQDLQKFPWYYMHWKWEYQIAYELIKPGEIVLEIGCGKGDFIEKLKKHNIYATGLEFNEEAIIKCREKALDVTRETIQEHAVYNKEKYDVVNSFQVMEHIAEIGDAIKASVEVLKKGGKLIISVPNNDSFLNKDANNLLNLPPHHMGLWGEESLKNMEKVFRVKLIKLFIEPLQSYHYSYYYNIVFGNKIQKKFGRFGDKVNKLFGAFIYHYLSTDIYPKNILGQTIMATYIKE